jgi:transcriptional regulator with XRE-family HTH domain
MNGEIKLLAQLLKEKREALGYSLRTLASITGVSFSTLARVEKCEGDPDNNTKIRIIEWLGDDARRAGLKFQGVTLVHFRARKKIDSATIQGLQEIANHLKEKYGTTSISSKTLDTSEDVSEEDVSHPISLTKDEMEAKAESFRKDLNLSDDEALDPFCLKIKGVRIMSLEQIDGISEALKYQLLNSARGQWDAMSVPLEEGLDKWAVVWNSHPSRNRQRVSLLEEIWHILLGHRLTKITKFAEVYGRTFDEVEEHDAYYLASATLLPATVIRKLVEECIDVSEVAKKYGTTIELVEYRIKRLGLWQQYKGMKVTFQIEK